MDVTDGPYARTRSGQGSTRFGSVRFIERKRRRRKMNSLGTLREAMDMALRAHKGQVDLKGEPHLAHTVRVMRAVNTDAEVLTALLHDVVEDSPITIGEVESVFGKEIADAVEAMTHFKNESYKDYVARACKNPIARKVKLADLMDHLHPDRVAVLDEKRRNKYWEAFWQVAASIAFEKEGVCSK
jgi:(p)ppGpp synthase/HD superfamily hydrolase